MAANTPKKARVNEVAALQALANGLTQHASTVPVVVLAGVALKPSDVVAKIQARLTVAAAVAPAAASWHAAVQADATAAQQIKPTLAAVKQTLLAAYSTQLDVLGDFGLTPRKKMVVSPATRTAAALKSKATREARGTTGKAQKAAITAPVVITPATATPLHVATATPAPVAPTAAAPASASPAPASPPALVTHS